MSAGDDERRASRARARRTWVLCGALVAGGVLVPAASASVSPRVTAGLAVCQGFALTTTSPNLGGALGGWSRGTDAWGNPVRIEERINVVTGAGTKTFSSLEVRSFGPDGRDDHGAGDDLVLTDDDLALAAAVDAAPVVGVLLAAALAWCLTGPFTHAPRDASTAREVSRAAGLAGLPALLVLGAGRLATLGPDRIFGDPLARLLDARAWPTLLVSPGWAVVLACAAIAFGLAYAWRVTRPRSAEPS